MKEKISYLQQLENESIYIIREVIAECENSAMLYSVGKDSAVMLHLMRKAFYPSFPTIPIVHVDTKWKFKEMIDFRDKVARDLGLNMIVYVNSNTEAIDISPFTHGSAMHTDIMKTQALKQMIDLYKFDSLICGARRDEEKSRAKERIYSFRDEKHQWNPKKQRPEMWSIYNGRCNNGESIRVFPLSNWTELDVWQYIYHENIEVPSLYYAKKRKVVEYKGQKILADDDRIPKDILDTAKEEVVRFRTLGCYPLTGAISSNAKNASDIIEELLQTKTSERHGRLIDSDTPSSMEKKKQQGYF